MNVTHFEVYAYDRSRGWVLHARFTGQERETAMDEARELERMGFKSRVAREIYDTEANTYEESDIYVSRAPDTAASSFQGGSAGKSKGGRAAPPARRGSSAASGGPSSSAKPSASERGESAGKQALSLIKSKAFTYIVIVLVIGFSCGLGVVRLLPTVITTAWNMGYHIDLKADSYENILLMAFAGAFILTAGPLFLYLMPKMFGKKASLSGSEIQDVKQQMIQQAKRKKVQESLDSLTKQALMEESAADVSPLDAPINFDDDEDDDEDDAPPPPAPEPSQEQADQGKSASLSLTEASNKMRTFVDSAVNAIKTTKTQLDNYNKFALHLYVAGAVDVLADSMTLVASDRRKLTANSLASLGTKGEMAEQFYDKVREYTVEERYRKMVDFGRSAMSDFLKGAEASAHGQLTGAIQEWSRGAAGATASSTITVMFTDMVGSTDMTQDRGDVAAQEIVRRHNTIVRMAISQFGGKEIKHTGDGIMASFDDATGAVDASIAIQRNVGSHNKARPDQPLQLRIGLNAGKPIQEENDIFGATVQLAARVCAATKPEQILCTESVQSRCRGRADVVQSVGSVPLKGFKDPIPLFEIKW